MCLMLDTMMSVLVYAALAFVAAVGALELAALRGSLEGLAWPLGLQRRRLVYLFASLMMTLSLVGGMLAGFLVAPPSPPLSAAAILVAVGLAVVVVIVGAAVRLRWNRRHRLPMQEGKPIEVGPLRATLYQPAGKGPVPGICLLPDPTAPTDDLGRLIQTLTQDRVAVLLFDWQSLRNADRLTLQGIVAVGVSHLARWPEIDGKRVGLLGVGLGGDLALRGAAIDAGVAAVLAMEPVLSPRRPGMGLGGLGDFSWFEAGRRARRWRRSKLARELEALGAIPCIAPRPVAVLTGYLEGSDSKEGLDILRMPIACSFAPVAHNVAVMRAADWFKEHLVW
jgi:hypothetical protein